MNIYLCYYQQNGEWHYLGEIRRQCAEIAIVETARKAMKNLKAKYLCFDVVKVERKK